MNIGGRARKCKHLPKARLILHLPLVNTGSSIFQINTQEWVLGLKESNMDVGGGEGNEGVEEG